jgi:hypothetical protein
MHNKSILVEGSKIIILKHWRKPHKWGQPTTLNQGGVVMIISYRQSKGRHVGKHRFNIKTIETLTIWVIYGYCNSNFIMKLLETILHRMMQYWSVCKQNKQCIDINQCHLSISTVTWWAQEHTCMEKVPTFITMK